MTLPSQADLDAAALAAALAACASEPIHIPGAIQPCGVLLALDPACETIVAASANAAALFGKPLSAMLGARAASLLGEQLPLRIRSLLAPARDGVVLPVEPGDGLLWMRDRTTLVHRYDQRVIVEVVDELFDAASERTVSASANTVAQVRRINETTAPEQHLEPLSVAAGFQRVAASQTDDPGLLSLCDRVADEVRRLTGYDRVMIYRFDAEANGSVIAEARRADLEPLLGLHYPAADIPAQARALYLRTRVRAMENVDNVPQALVAAGSSGAQRPIDLSHAVLRSMSPIHLQYLRNMGVSATLVVSIIVDGQLWGLISCHHLSPKWPSYAMRATCDMLSEFVSVQVTVQESVSRASARARGTAAQSALIRHMMISGGRLEEVIGIIGEIVPCGGVAIMAEGRVHLLGETPSEGRVRDLVGWLRQQAGGRVTAYDTLVAANPDFADIAAVASGVLAVDIGGTQAGFLLWFRPEEPHAVRWAGAREKVRIDDGGVPRLSPRGSFEEWVEQRSGRAAPWTVEEVTIAESVCDVLVEVVLELLTTRHRIVRIQSSVEAASDAIAITDARGLTVYLNPAFHTLTGYRPDEVTNPWHVFREAAPLRVSDSPPASLRRDVRAEGRDGTQIPVALRVDQIVDDEGGVIGTLFMATDLRPRLAVEEERRRLDQKLLQTQQLESLGVLAGGIAHDFNNLLTTIVANAALAFEDLPPVSGVKENLQAISRAAQHAASLCRELLAYAGRGRFLVQPLVVNDLVADITNLLRTAIGTECTIGYHLAGGLPLVEADAAQLRQVVMNLIVNASDAIGAREGRIDVTTTVWDVDRAMLDTYQQSEELEPGRYVEIRVADTGSGMSPETMARIFDPFFTTKFTGRGLGLAAVLGIVRGHRGALRLTSTFGAGTTFSVLLPAATSDKKPIAGTRRAGRVDGAGRTILLVDDNLALRESAQRILERSDFRVLLAEDGVAALEVIESATVPIALVLSDISMPRMGGSELWARIRQDGSTVPLLLTSGYSEEESLADIVDDPRTGFVQKPFTIDQLLGSVSALLASATP